MWCSADMMSTGPPFLVATVSTPCAAACTAHHIAGWHAMHSCCVGDQQGMVPAHGAHWAGRLVLRPPARQDELT